MGRPRDTDLDRALKVARKTLARILALDPAIAPKWHAGMVHHWGAEVDRMEALKASRRQAH